MGGAFQGLGPQPILFVSSVNFMFVNHKMVRSLNISLRPLLLYELLMANLVTVSSSSPANPIPHELKHISFSYSDDNYLSFPEEYFNMSILKNFLKVAPLCYYVIVKCKISLYHYYGVP